MSYVEELLSVVRGFVLNERYMNDPEMKPTRDRLFEKARHVLKKSASVQSEDKPAKSSGVYVYSRDLMRRLLSMANMEGVPAKRIVLDVEVDAVPVLYVESFLDRQQTESTEPPVGDVEVRSGTIDTTTILNQHFRTHVPLNEPEQH